MILKRLYYSRFLKKLFHISFYEFKMAGGLRGLFTRGYPKRPLNFEVYRSHLKDKNGIEVGGPSPIFKKNGILPVYPLFESIDLCNFVKSNEKIKYVCDAIDLSFIPSNKYDFLLSSHVIEHFTNPLKALIEWKRVISEGGISLIIIPHKDGSYDHNRPVSSLAHFIEDFNNNTPPSDRTHLSEIVELTDIILHPYANNIESYKNYAIEGYGSRNRNAHQHVFNTESAVEMINYINLQILSVEAILPFHIVILAKKVSDERSINNQIYLNKDASWRKESPFPSDRNN